MSHLIPRCDGLLLHQRLRNQDPTATSDISALYLPVILAHLQERFPCADPHLITSAAHEALIGYLQNPTQFDPSRSDLGAFLCMAARGDLKNLRQREMRHQRKRISLELVEIDLQDGNSSSEEDAASRLIREENEAEVQSYLKQVRESCTAEERAAVDLLLDGVRDTRAYVPVLHLESHPAEQQERAVKQWKDRLKKRLQRGWRHHG